MEATWKSKDFIINLEHKPAWHSTSQQENAVEASENNEQGNKEARKTEFIKST